MHLLPLHQTKRQRSVRRSTRPKGQADIRRRARGADTAQKGGATAQAPRECRESEPPETCSAHEGSDAVLPRQPSSKDRIRAPAEAAPDRLPRERRRRHAKRTSHDTLGATRTRHNVWSHGRSKSAAFAILDGQALERSTATAEPAATAASAWILRT
eukprot:Amastigsp_a194624_17.p1 type:complete len:157 gc:universal Amastigsp_a194624_17:9-479(+)